MKPITRSEAVALTYRKEADRYLKNASRMYKKYSKRLMKRIRRREGKIACQK